ncbi:hypothetical protein DSCW_52150 [Desulfosarcina widdelii]|uniref:Uncharacterized protein n=1 Tax=Desulfosarcina widdelii TaxID=947919 RepID=A0A5K7Z9S3_9BACT|nr:hypothetical protein [Desulfosarcina widdelii]BBO77798.1 hypothetical protein DSCW_52150 [Desulfosarcina widdelii]
MDEAVKPKWYDNKPVIILFLIIFFPLGLYNLWKSTVFSVRGKTVLSMVIAVLIITFYHMESTNNNHSSTLNISAESQPHKSVIQASLDDFKSEIPLSGSL